MTDGLFFPFTAALISQEPRGAGGRRRLHLSLLLLDGEADKDIDVLVHAFLHVQYSPSSHSPCGHLSPPSASVRKNAGSRNQCQIRLLAVLAPR